MAEDSSECLEYISKSPDWEWSGMSPAGPECMEGEKKSLHEHKRIRKSTESKKSRFNYKEICKREQSPGGPIRPTCSKAGEEQTVLGGRGIQKANSPGKLQNSNSLETSVCSKTWTSVGTRHERISSVQFNHSVVSDSLRPHGLQHARPPCPSPTSGTCSNSCPSSWWCHPATSSSVVPFSSCPQSFPASGSFQMSQLFASGG